MTHKLARLKIRNDGLDSLAIVHTVHVDVLDRCAQVQSHLLADKLGWRLGWHSLLSATSKYHVTTHSLFLLLELAPLGLAHLLRLALFLYLASLADPLADIEALAV